MTNWNDSICNECGKTPRDCGYIDAEAWTQWECPNCGGELKYIPIGSAVVTTSSAPLEHVTNDGANCWCEPEIIDGVIVHRRTDN